MRFIDKVERFLVIAGLLYFALGTVNEILLESADNLKSSSPPMSVVYHGIEFESAGDAAIYQKEEYRDKYFFWAGAIPLPACYILLASVLAAFGAWSRDIYDVVNKGMPPTRAYVVGLVIGPFLYLIGSLVPFLAIDINHWPTPRLLTFSPTCVIGGAFLEKTWSFIETLPDKIFKHKEK